MELDKESRGLTATLSGDWLDEFMGGGSSRVDLALRRGRLVLGPAAAAADAPPAGPGTAGGFGKATLTAQRQQTVTKDVGGATAIELAAFRQEPRRLRKTSLGGPGSLPGYVGGEGSGDVGVHAKLTVRWQALPELSLSAFTDYARLRIAHDPLPTAATNAKRLTDAGLAADWLVGRGVTANLILAWAGKEAPNPADNDKPRFWFSLGWAW